MHVLFTLTGIFTVYFDNDLNNTGYLAFSSNNLILIFLLFLT